MALMKNRVDSLEETNATYVMNEIYCPNKKDDPKYFKCHKHGHVSTNCKCSVTSKKSLFIIHQHDKDDDDIKECSYSKSKEEKRVQINGVNIFTLIASSR